VIVEAEEPLGVVAGGLVVSLAIRRHGQFAHLLGGPLGRCLGQRGVSVGLGHLDQRFDLVERKLALGEGLGDLRE
jgi:hypothetical protein